MKSLAKTLRDNNAAVRARRDRFTSCQGEAETQRQIDRAFRIAQWGVLTLFVVLVAGAIWFKADDLGQKITAGLGL